MIAAEYYRRAPCRAALRDADGGWGMRDAHSTRPHGTPRLRCGTPRWRVVARCADSTLTFDWWWIVGGEAGDDARCSSTRRGRPRPMPTGAGARTARTAGGDYSVTTQGVTAPVWNRKGAPRGTRSLVFSRRLAPIRHPARNTSTRSWTPRADPIGRPARIPRGSHWTPRADTLDSFHVLAHARNPP